MSGHDRLRQRDPQQREAAYLGWIARLPCVACMCAGRVNREVQVAHIRFSDHAAGWRGAGMQEKPHDRLTVPLCQPHHTGDRRRVRLTQHHMGERDFWDTLGVDIVALVAELNHAFEAGRQGYPVISAAAATAHRNRTCSSPTFDPPTR